MIDTENQCVEINMSYFCKIVIFYTDFFNRFVTFFPSRVIFFTPIKKAQENKVVLFSWTLLFYFTSEINPVSTSYTAPEITTSSGIKGEAFKSSISSRTLSSMS